MTVSANTARDQYTATSGQTVFNYTFQIDRNTEISVWQRAAGSSPDDSADLLTLTTDYTVTGVGAAGGGTIVLVTGATTGDIISIESSIPTSRDTSFTPGGIIQAEDLNTEFDNEILIYQRLLTRAEQRTLTYPASAIITPSRDCVMPILGVEQVWRMNEAGTAMEAFTLSGSAGLQADLASNAAGKGASLVGLQNQGSVSEQTVQDLANAAFIVQTNNGSMVNAQALGDLSSGVLKSATTSGVVSISTPLTSIDGLTTSADKMIYTTGSNVYATTDLTAFARSLLDDTSAANAATTLAVLPLAGGTMTGTLTLAADPTSALEAATKQYVDSIAFNVLPAAKAATTANLAGYTYDNGTSGVGATLTAGSNGAFSTDGVSPALNDRILVKDQTSAPQNGVYVLSQVGDGSNPAILTRATDFDESSEMDEGDSITVISGTEFSGTTWIMTQSATIVVGTTDITWTEQSLSGALLKSNNLSDVDNVTTSRNNLSAQEDLSGLSITTATVATDDKVLIQDTDDADNLKTVTAQSIANLAPGAITSFQFLTSGTGATYTKPAGITSILVELVGGGGGGGGCDNDTSLAGAAGSGGGGGYCRKFFSSAASTYTYTVGAGGAGGAAGNNNGSTGGTTSFDTMSATGGTGGGGRIASGSAAVSTGVGAGGTASNGDVNMKGGPGNHGVSFLNSAFSGQGGNSYFAGGAIGSRVSSSVHADGTAGGSNTGGGGSGGIGLNTTTDAAGGDGGSGVIIVWEFS